MSAAARAGLTTEIPMTFRRRAGKAVIVLPNGERAVERREPRKEINLRIARGKNHARSPNLNAFAERWGPLV